MMIANKVSKQHLPLNTARTRAGINLLGLTCVVAATATWMAFILSSLLIVSTVAWSDGCHFLALAARQGWETAGLDGQSAAVLDGCFHGRSVADEFNLTEALAFFDSYAVIADEVRRETLFLAVVVFLELTSVRVYFYLFI